MEIGIEKNKICCFSGYRPEKLPWRTDEEDLRCAALKERIYNEVSRMYDFGIRHYICGMARGSDTYFCEAVLKLRSERQGIIVEAAIPCEEQAARWFEADRNRYFKLVAKCDIETYISRAYTGDCMQKRNRYMVDKSSVLLTVFDGKLGGTMQTIGYAKKRGLEIIIIEPEQI